MKSDPNINDLVALNATKDAVLWRVVRFSENGYGIGIIDATIERVQPNQPIQWIDKCYLRKPLKAQLANFKH